MTILGQRKSGLGALYSFTLIFSIIVLIYSISLFWVNSFFPILIIIGVGIMATVSICILVAYYKTPKIAITYDGQCTIYVKGQPIKLTDITYVSYRRASAKGIQYKWGSVTISTSLDKYKVSFLENCEMVEKAITKLVYENNQR